MHHTCSRALTRVLTASLLLWASIVGTPATAEQVIVTFTGAISTGNAGLTSLGLQPPFTNSLTLSGSYTYDDSTRDRSSLSNAVGQYDDAIDSMTLNFGNRTYVATLSARGFGSVHIETSSIPFSFNAYQYVVSTPIEGHRVGSLEPASFQMGIIGFIPLFSDLNDDLVPPTLGQLLLEQAGFRMTFFNRLLRDSDVSVDGRIHTLSTAVVPLPPAAILFGAGLVALVGLGARNWRQKKSGLA